MKTNFTFWNCLLFVLFSTSVSAQSSGDYRSVKTGSWSTASTWQTYNGSAWVTASSAPSSANGAITIRTGDSIILSSAISIDQVFIQNGGVLDIFSNGGAYTVTLNDNAADDDIIVSGKLYISIAATVAGTGSIRNNNDGIVYMRYSGTLAAPATNNGTFYLNTTGALSDATLTNNKTFVWLDNNLNLSNATFINNDSVVVTSSAFVYITGNGTFNNAAGAVLYRTNPAAKTTVNSTVNFINSGTVKGYGEYRMSGTVTNNGIVSPGNGDAASLTINPFFVNAKTPTYNLILNSEGAVAGTNYQQIVFSTVVNASLDGATLNVSDNANDPLGTVYTLFSSPTSNITGTFAAVNLASTLGNLTYNATSVTVEKTSVLPLVWGDFTAVAVNKQARLTWSTLREVNVSHFEIENSLDGSTFSLLATATAAGNSTGTETYTYTDLTPTQNVVNYYRIKEVGLDGSISYSATRSLDFTTPISVIITISPNPVRDLIYIYVPSDATLLLTDMAGRALRTRTLTQGSNQFSVADLPGAAYHVAIFQKGTVLKSQLIVKY